MDYTFLLNKILHLNQNRSLIEMKWKMAVVEVGSILSKSSKVMFNELKEKQIFFHEEVTIII